MSFADLSRDPFQKKTNLEKRLNVHFQAVEYEQRFILKRC